MKILKKILIELLFLCIKKKYLQKVCKNKNLKTIEKLIDN